MVSNRKFTHLTNRRNIMKALKLNINHARKVLAVVDAGLVNGVGNPIPGEMCVEAAVCYALGLPHGDDPKCVGEAVRAFKISLNDSSWSSTKARAKGMRRVAIAQLGSNKINQKEFAKQLAIGTVQKIVPLALRAAASAIPSHAEALNAAAIACEVVTTLSAASYAASAAASDARAASAAASDARAASAASDAASYAASDAARAASYAASDAARAASYAASYAARAARAASDAASYAASAAASAAASDAVLSLAAEVAVTALKKCKALGVKWLRIAS
jgi:hypothetical protein